MDDVVGIDDNHDIDSMVQGELERDLERCCSRGQVNVHCIRRRSVLGCVKGRSSSRVAINTIVVSVTGRLGDRVTNNERRSARDFVASTACSSLKLILDGERGRTRLACTVVGKISRTASRNRVVTNKAV